MESLRELYKIGRGPSSSHTMGPAKAAQLFKALYPDADAFRVDLFGSLSATGKGHKTDVAVKDELSPAKTEVRFAGLPDTPLEHENTMDFYALQNGKQIGSARILSVGGGEIRVVGKPQFDKPQIYPLQSFAQISALCASRNIRLSDYVFEQEGADFRAYLHDIWRAMKQSILDGLTTNGVLDGGLGVERKAQLQY